MKKISLAPPLLAIVLLGACAPSMATQEASSVQEFLIQVRLKLERLTPQRTQTVTTAVSGVRGLEASASDVYWKGEARLVTDLEMAKLKEALADLEEGRAELAKTALQQFLNDHPDSELGADALAALGLIAGK